MEDKEMTEQEVQEWVDYYMEGGELPDEIQQQVLGMALEYAKAKK